MRIKYIHKEKGNIEQDRNLKISREKRGVNLKSVYFCLLFLYKLRLRECSTLCWKIIKKNNNILFFAVSGFILNVILA